MCAYFPNLVIVNNFVIVVFHRSNVHIAAQDVQILSSFLLIQLIFDVKKNPNTDFKKITKKLFKGPTHSKQFQLSTHRCFQVIRARNSPYPTSPQNFECSQLLSRKTRKALICSICHFSSSSIHKQKIKQIADPTFHLVIELTWNDPVRFCLFPFGNILSISI